MADPSLAGADPAPASAPKILVLAETYPACFDGENPRPLKLGIHHDLMAAGFEKAAVKRTLARYCNRPRYRKALRAGAIRIDLQGQPAGVVTAAEAETARAAWKADQPAPSCPAAASLPANDTPLPQEALVPGRLELTVKFSELPQPLAVQGGLKIGIQTGEGIVTAILPPKIWRKLEQAAQNHPHWIAALSGSLARFADGEISLKHPTVQVFERKVRPEVAAEGKGPELDGPAVEAPEPNAPDVNASAGKKPEEKASAVQTPDRTTPDSPPPAAPYPKLSLKGRGASGAG
ncbi:MAG: ProQ/FinO family protein [Gammaproteobacteria bacterium]|nr:ProQ/FinO family protein [Gammaproteobacteria bacterium]